MEAKVIALQFCERKPDNTSIGNKSIELGFTRNCLLPMDITWVPVRPILDVNKSELDIARLRGLLMGSVDFVSSDHRDPRAEWIAGIILHEVPDRRNVFERVGTWSLPAQGSHDCTESCERTPCVSVTRDCFARTPDTRITII
jgi:hypothetical protein